MRLTRMEVALNCPRLERTVRLITLPNRFGGMDELGKHGLTTGYREKYTGQQTEIFGPDEHWQQIQRCRNVFVRQTNAIWPEKDRMRGRYQGRR